MKDDAQWIAQETNRAIKCLYKELEKKNERLKEVDKLKSNFVSVVSHELRTPLSIIRQGAELLQRKILGDLNDRQVEILSDVIEGTDRLVKIINDLLDVAKLEAKKVEIDTSNVDTAGIIRKVMKEFKVKVESKGILFEENLPQNLPHLDADETKIIQVLTNLLGNAVKFTSQGGKIEVLAKGDGDFVEIAVCDTGVGIGDEDISKLFSKFQQFGRQHGPGEKGTGLGLAICKEIVHLHGGKIRAVSEVNKGSTFYFTIPRYKDPGKNC